MRGELVAQNQTERFLGRTWRRAIIVCEIEVGDSNIERVQQKRPTVVVVLDGTEIVPQPE